MRRGWYGCWVALVLACAGCALDPFLGGGASSPGGAWPGRPYPPDAYPPPPGRGPVVRCESRDSRTRHCRADTRGGVRVQRQLSDTPCIRGQSWGVDGGSIWVSRGCRADFVVGHGGAGGGYSQIIRCESRDKRQRRCPARVEHGVTLVRQLSNSACIRGSNWDWDRNGVWVSGGCRAEFSVR